MNQERHPCPCCGYQTYLEPAGGTMQICPVCFWEDAPGEYWYNRSNKITLREAQVNFRKTGAAEASFLDAVRPPLLEEADLLGWRPMADEAAAIIRQIETAFASVHRDGGVTLHQKEVLDHYGNYSEEDFVAAGKKDPERTWQEISPEKLDHLGLSFALMDAKGLRFYLPAYLRLFLLNWVDGGYHDCCGLMFSLEDGPEGYYEVQFKLLNDSQRAAIAAFLSFAAIHGAEFHHDELARQALRNGWNKWAMPSPLSNS